MIKKNSTNFYSKEVTVPSFHKMEFKMAMVVLTMKTVIAQQLNKEDQKKKLEKYHDTNQHRSTKKNSRTVSCFSF